MVEQKAVKMGVGWGFPGAARRWHYWDEDHPISICRNWWYHGDRYEEIDVPDAGKCARCRAILKQRSRNDDTN